MTDRKFKDMQDAFENGDGKNRGSDRHVGFGSESQSELDEKVLKEYSEQIKKYNERLNKGIIKYTPEPKKEQETSEKNDYIPKNDKYKYIYHNVYQKPETKNNLSKNKKDISNKPQKQKKNISNKNIQKSELNRNENKNERSVSQPPKETSQNKQQQDKKPKILYIFKCKPSNKLSKNVNSHKKVPKKAPQKKAQNNIKTDNRNLVINPVVNPHIPNSIISLFYSQYRTESYIDIRRINWDKNMFYRVLCCPKKKTKPYSIGSIYINEKRTERNISYDSYEVAWVLA